MMGGGILIWLILGIALYWLLFKKGGGAMGCCGGHSNHPPDSPGRSNHSSSGSERADGEIIDLKKEDYHVQP